MKRQRIPFEAFALRPLHRFNDAWLLLCAGANRPGAYNVMTISWGGLGVIWNKPLVMVVVRPSRHTYQFMERGTDFTVCGFPEAYRDRLTLCGTRSGRELDKVQACGLTPIPSAVVAAPGFDEAELILECRKMYYDDLEPRHFLAEHIETNYGGRDYHRMYFGELLAIHGTAAYRQR